MKKMKTQQLSHVIITTLILVFGIDSAKAQFSTQSEISKSVAYPIDAILVDLNNDGNLDILCASRDDDKVSWYENLGSGNFGTQQVITTDAESVRSIDAADLDNDGDVDVVSASQQDAKVAWYENLGNGTFDYEKLLPNNNEAVGSIRIADLDQDGFADILCAGSAEVTWYHNNADGTFSSKISIDNLYAAVRTAFDIDVDLDGLVDVVATSDAVSAMVWYKNLGNGDFGGDQLLDNWTDGIRAKNTSDMDGDGDLDILAGSFPDDLILLYENIGGDFLWQTIGSADGPYNPFPADVDGDGDQDIIAVSHNNDQIKLLKNNGTGGFSSTSIITSLVDAPETAVAGDIDNDGDTDILVTGSADDQLTWLENNGTGSSFVLHNIPTNVHVPEGVDCADFNGDGRIDVCVVGYSDYQTSWFQNLGNGEFSDEIVISTTSGHPVAIQSADVDSDGDADIVTAANYTGEVVWYQNLGGGTFSSAISTGTVSANGESLHISDIDLDGDPDILIQPSTSDIIWLENNGLGNFAAEQNMATSTGTVGSIYTADLNADGLPDVLYAAQYLDEVKWQQNLGGGLFGPVQIVSTTVDGAIYVRAADLDNDGDNDILAAGEADAKIRWFENLGLGTFGPEITIDAMVDVARIVEACDLDLDGDLDVICGPEIGGVGMAWYENDGSGSFISGYEISDKVHGFSGLSFADFDNDGDKDLVSSSTGDNRVAWYENYFRSSTKMHGTKFYDENENEIFDPGEVGLNLFTIYKTPGNQLAFNSSSGEYFFSLPLGTHTVGYTEDTLWHLTTDSVTYTRTISMATPSHYNLDFGFYPDTILTRLKADLTGGFPRCNSTVNYWLNVQNTGTTLPSGVIHLQLDDSLTYVTAIFSPDSIVGQNIYWSYDSLYYSSIYSNMVQVEIPAFQVNPLISQLNVFLEDSLENLVLTQNDSIIQHIVCAYDPNDKTVLPQGLGSPGYIAPDQQLEYLVRFQNTGNDTAITVMLRDQLDADLDWSTFQIISYSHTMNAWMEDDGEVVFHFENIMLPDSNVNFAASQGFVKYSISPLPSLEPGTQLLNNAAIYFDYNEPVLTNSTLNTIYDCNSITPDISGSIICFGQDVTGNIASEEFNSYTWDLDGTILSTTDSVTWTANSFGALNLKVEVVNDICTVDSIIPLFVPEVVAPTVLTHSICQGDSTYLQGDYQTLEGVYVDSLQSQFGCDSVVYSALFLMDLPSVVLLDFPTDTICSDDIISLPLAFPSSGVYSGNGVTAGTFDAAVAGPGNHSLVYSYTDGNGCLNSDTSWIYVTSCLSIREYNPLSAVIYPNPNTGDFTLMVNTSEAFLIRVYSSDGRLIYEQNTSENNLDISLDVAEGIYFAEIITQGNDISVVKIIVKK
jgi:uncharacterized repeat protein (TIGR01451 family)